MTMCIRFVILMLVVLTIGAAAAKAQLQARTSPVYIEDSPAVGELVDKARRLQQQQRLRDAVRAYQEIIDQYPDKLIEQEDGLYVGAAHWVRRTLRSDQQLLIAYRTAHEPLALRMLELTKGDEHVAEALARVVKRYALCRSGLQAGLLLAGRYLESGRITSAATILDELQDHRDIAASAWRYHLLQAAVGLYSGDKQKLKHHRDKLLGDAASLAQIDDWSSRTVLSWSDLRAAASRREAGASVPKPLGQPLWRARVGEDLGTAIKVSVNRSRLRIMTPNANSSNLQPVAAGEMVYVATADTVVAIDRNSGRPRWTWLYANVTLLDSRAAIGRRQLGLWGIARAVCVSDDSVLAIIGSPGIGRNLIASSTQLVCLDRRDGRERWRIKPGELDETLNNAYFHGTPMVVHGRLIVAVRRSQQSSIEDAYVAAVDLDSGKMLWKRHLVSANSFWGPMTSDRSSTQWIERGGRLYVADIMGAAACIDMRDGSVVWLAQVPMTHAAQRSSARVLRIGRVQRNVLELAHVRPISQPLFAAAGLVVPTFDRRLAPVLLDPRTGRTLRRLTGPGWMNASYYLAGGDHVISIGSQVLLVDGRSFKVLKTCALPLSLSGLSPGIATLGSQRLLLPVANRLFEIDLAQMQVVMSYDIGQPGHMLVLDSQVIVTTGYELRSYMNWPHAYTRLQRQMSDTLYDPEPALALAHLALAADRAQQVLEGADEALACLNRLAQRGDIADETSTVRNQAMRARHLVFGRLLEFIERNEKIDTSLRHELFDRLAAATSGPADMLAYHLALGKFLTQISKPTDAIEHYQLVLMDRTLSGQLYRWKNGSRRGGDEARLRQAELIRKDQSIYERYEVTAAQQLAQLRRTGDAQLADYLTLAQQYPLSRAAPEALLVASEMVQVSGELRLATDHLHRAYAMAQEAGLARRIVEKLAPLYVQQGRARRARRCLAALRWDYPDVQPLRNGEPVSVDQWLSALDVQSIRPGRIGRLVLPLTESTVIKGKWLTPGDRIDRDWMTDVIVLHDGASLRICDARSFAERLRIEVGDGAVQLLDQTEEQLIVYHESARQISGYEIRTGRRLWPRINLSQLLPLHQRKQQHAIRPVRNGRPGGPRVVVQLPGQRLIPEGSDQRAYFVKVQDQVICVGYRSGQVIGIDRQSGLQLWRVTLDVDRVVQFIANDSVLVLGAQRVADPQNVTGAIVVIDLLTGRKRLDKTIRLSHPLLWLGLRDNGEILGVTARQVVCYRSSNVDLKWHLTMANLAVAGGVYRSGNRLLLMGVAGMWQVVDIQQGELISSFTRPLPTSVAAIGLAQQEDQWHVLYTRQAVALGADGSMRWHDAIDMDDKNLIAQFLTEKYVVLLSQTKPRLILPMNLVNRVNMGQGVGGVQVRARNDLNLRRHGKGEQSYAYRLYLLDRAGGSIVDEYDLGAMSGPIDPAASLVVDNQLMLTSDHQTVVIAGDG